MTIDLNTGLDYEPRREDYITKIAATYLDPDCPIPLWRKFLGEVTAENDELQAYLQRMAGYCMTGDTTEHVLFFFYGSGANGKSVFINTLAAIWGDYAVTAPMEMFIASHNDRHPTELAYLRAARLVTAQETEKGRRWAESKIKALTGGDPITARYMRQDFFTFTPQFKLLIAGNYKPSLRSVDEAIRRRFHLVPFVVTIPKEKRDGKLFEKLKAEWPGILQWALSMVVLSGKRSGWRPLRPSAPRPTPISQKRTQSGTGWMSAATLHLSADSSNRSCTRAGSAGPRSLVNIAEAQKPSRAHLRNAVSTTAGRPELERKCSQASR
jgi:putative DNA primase/helicase